MRIFVCLSALLMLSACGTGQFGSSYRGYLTPEIASNVVMLGVEQEPILIRSNDIDRDVMKYREHNYVVIGESAFNGFEESEQNAVRQAKEVMATHVVVSSEYTDTESRIEYDYQDVYTTVFVSRVKTVNGERVAVQEAVTVRDTITVPYMRHYDNFDQWAVYMVKSNQVHKLGFILRDLNQQERAMHSRNTGTIIDVVLSNSPAFLADIVQGDVLLAINDDKITDRNHAIRLIRALEINGQTIVLSMLKNGEQKDITFEFNS
ncbi:MAG: PDZ domain-containing protein [Emcibacteraceae bacterium]|nr:PDZ domain-containing protein [Emcibacteraceae bacterium]